MLSSGVLKRGQASSDDLLDVPEEYIGEIVNGALMMSPRPAPPHLKCSSLLGSMPVPPFFANLDIVRAKNRVRLGRSRAAGDAGSPADADTDIDDTDDTDTSSGASDSEIADALMSPETPNNGDSPDSELVN